MNINNLISQSKDQFRNVLFEIFVISFCKNQIELFSICILLHGGGSRIVGCRYDPMKMAK